MKGIVLAGGEGTRLYPLTTVTSKQLLPVYDKPMIYYPLSTLMLAGIREILIISTPHDIDRFKSLLGDGSRFGISLSYEIQKDPNGLAEAFIIGEKFIGNESCALILGDNIFYGSGFRGILKDAVRLAEDDDKATIFGYYVQDPERFGVVTIDEAGKPVRIVEKPARPESNYAVTGLYFYPSGISARACKVERSSRGELEITTLNQMYLEEEKLHVKIFGRGFAWIDAGTMDSLIDAADFVRIVENRQGIMIASLEEIAYINGWIDREKLLEVSEKYGKSPYGEHLKTVAQGRIHYEGNQL